MTLSWPNHLLTLEEWEALPESEGVRLELAEGLVVMSPKPLFFHQRAAMRLGYRLDEQLPQELTALTEVEVVVSVRPATVRVPDIIVTRSQVVERNPPRLSADDLLLAVEVLSDGTRRVDRVLKFSEYAEARIPQYWIIDLGQPHSLTAYVLVDGDYELSGEHTGIADLDVSGHCVTVDLAALTQR
ncbi:Uma2 family endonuclease [Pseudonocardia alaniniphila]|uniref:Uma2 family endonuclease n=1 Tax=Pseudonocardia alaniniphila TaxID=75291 RepID=A0ABS9TIF5_9PSEU|nr:Uma2 family endonuclease [Pseudonocardia alaniniphila]MCH6168340.1 Uma2 family endonuclease [Pseudonocardia alaniniphila]